MKDIIIYGAGGFGREVALLLQQINLKNPQWNILGFFDDGLPKESRVDGLKIFGGMKEAMDYKGAMAMAVADPSTRKKITTTLNKNSIHFPALVHPSALLGSTEFNKIEEGCILCAGVIMTTHIYLQSFSIINLATTIGHDVTIGSYSTVMPGSSISGNVNIGAGCLLGTGSRTLQNIDIGDASVIGAGAVVTKTCSPNSKLIGVPARDLRNAG